MEELEPRLLFSADSPVLAIDPRSLDADTPPPVPAITQVAAVAEIAVRDQSRDSIEQRREVVFVDASAPNYRQLIDDLTKSAEQGRKVDIIVIDSDRDGIEQITEVLSRYRNLDAVHLVSHGSDGRLQIGSSQLTQDTVRRYAYVIQSWGEALKADADLLLYGCDLASSGKGQALINDLATLTGADVAASTDLTGSSLLGGDWDLEYQVGDIETDVAFSDQAQQHWTGVLATETVRDEFDVVGYSGTNGTQPWASDWIEVNDDGSPASGQYSLVADPIDGLPTGLGLRIGDLTGPTTNFIQRAVDLSGATSATLTFDFRRDGGIGYGADPAKPMTLDISTDGGGLWQNLMNFDNGLDIVPTIGQTIDISSYITSNTLIRIGQESAFVSGFIHFDNIEISYETGPPQGTALWAVAGANQPETNQWDGTDFTTDEIGDNVGQYTVMTAAEAPTRDEIIVIGVDTGGDITAQLGFGSTWNEVGAPLSTPLASISDNTSHSFDVAYESNSGDALMVWSDGTGGNRPFKYAVWDGTAWTNPPKFDAGIDGQVIEMHLAADPNSNEMVLVISNTDNEVWALVWDGDTDSWGDERLLDDGTGVVDSDDAVFVVYQQLSGDAVVVYSDRDAGVGDDLYYRIWDGSWGAQGTITHPGLGSDRPDRITMAAHAGSDTIGLAVRTDTNEVWTAVWDGSGPWIAALSGSGLTGGDADSMAVAFEHDSGDALFAWGKLVDQLH
jgi:hypothetical protein